MRFRQISNLYGKPKTIVSAFSITVLALFLISIYVFNDYITIETILKYYNSDVANVSGVLCGFVFASFGLIIGLKNETITKLIITNNIKAVHKVLLYTVFYFLLSIIVYFVKPLIIWDVSYISEYSILTYRLIKYFLLFGLYCFTNAFALFIVSLYILKRLLTN